ncbi:MAG: serine/threonine-protein phosphatase, partial [Pseudomonadota bacterium]
TVRRAEGSDCDHVAGEASEPETTRPATSHVAVAERPNNTLTGVTLNWVSVGDSPLYLVRDGEIAMLNEDHSLAPALDQLVAEGRMSAEDARNDHRRHMLRSAVSGEVMELIDVSARPLEIETGDIIIIATDGLQTLEPDEIARIAIGYRGDGASVVCDALLRAVGDTRLPYQDNATVIVLIAKDGSA